MSDATLEIELAAGPWKGEEYTDCWPVGGRISGIVRAHTLEPVKARGVRVELEWHTTGRGDRDRDVVSTAELHSGDLDGPNDYKWPFELRVPEAGPISYAGHYVNIHWVVRAVIDIAWARDPTAERPIQVLPDYDPAATS